MHRSVVSIRDLLSWVQFINATASTMDDCGDNNNCDDIDVKSKLEPMSAYLHGACLVFIDALGAGRVFQTWHFPNFSTEF